METLRLQHHLTREALARLADMPLSTVDRICQNRHRPTPANLTKLLRVLNLDTWQHRHLHELFESAAPLPSTDELRGLLSGPAITDHLDHYDNRDILVVYFDPLRTVLTANRAFHRVVPGLEHVEDNFALWLFTPTARTILDNWEAEALRLVTTLRAALGHHRDSPRAHHLFRQLRAYPEFNRLWETTAGHVTYGRRPPTPMHLHTPDTHEHRTLCFEVHEFGGHTDIHVIHATYDPPAPTG
ncbi:MmyB family transcriptional regulator [Nocardia bovistercoris]|uniref:MmyB family transcriptional regulator n=1 Tax=Nocardia bovistercoris TaxID=2785916 RepID=UPI002FCCF24B